MRASTPCAAIRGKCNSIVNRVVRHNKRADRGTVQSEDEIPFPMARHCPISYLSWTLADHDLRHDKGLASSGGARTRQAQRPPGTQTGGQLAAQSATALHVEGLVNGLVTDAHRLMVREVEPQAMGNLLRAPCRSPTPVLPRSVSATFPRYCRPGNRSSAWQYDYAGQSILHIFSQQRVGRQLCRLRPAACPFSMPLRRRCPILQAAAARRGIAPAALVRSSMPNDPSAERSPVSHCPAHEGSQAPPAPQTPDIAQTIASMMPQTSMVACRPPPGTNVSQPLATPPRTMPHPRSTGPLRSPPRTAAGPRDPPPPAAPATPTYPAAPDPNVVDPPSPHPPSRCCDDQLNSPNIPASNFRSSWPITVSHAA